MGKVCRFKTPQDNLVEHIEYILEKAKQGEIKSIALSAECSDGEIATSYFNADVVKKQELMSHMQVDIMYQVIEANMDRLVEYV